MRAGGGHFTRRRPRHVPHQLGIERRRQAELRRKNGGAGVERVAVNAVFTDQQRNTEPCSLSGVHRRLEPLVENVKERAGRIFLHLLHRLAAPVELHHLADFFGQRHAREQVFYAGFDGQAGIEIRGASHGRTMAEVEPTDKGLAARPFGIAHTNLAPIGLQRRDK